jgi:photosystem II stability/assembly factor-like uncharacterized protein
LNDFLKSLFFMISRTTTPFLVFFTICTLFTIPFASYSQAGKPLEKRYRHKSTHAQKASVYDEQDNDARNNNKSSCSTIDSLQKDGDDYEVQEHLNERNEYAHAHSTWYREMLKKRPNIEKAQQAFSNYFSTHTEDSKLKGRFETWVKQASLYKDKHGFARAYPFARRKQKAVTGVTGLTSVNGTFGTWTMIGPANMTRTECNNSNKVTGGFCDRVFVNPYNTQNLFAGFSYGGLWVSTDQGATWHLTEGSFANGTNTYANRDYYYGEIEAHKLNNNLVFAATEAGLLKSTNSGINWSLSPILNRNNSLNNRPYYIALATDDQNIVLSTFGRQVYRSADGGNTWTMVFDNSGGGSNHSFTNQYNKNTPFGLNDRTYNFFGLEADFNDPNHFYLGVWNSSNQACIYESKDKGLSFTLLVNLNISLSATWGSGTTLCLKTIPSSATKFFVYEQFAASGKPYYKFSSTGALLSASPINAYPEAFDIDWNDENILYEGQYSPNYILKSNDGGASFVKPYSNTAPNCNYLHADIRGISAVGNVVLIGNDGGLGLSTDGGNSLTGTGFEINSMDIWGFSSSVKSDICLAGLDHNQTFVRSFSGAGGWKNIKGADAGVCTVNPYDDHWLYYDWAYGVNKGYLNADGTVSESSVSALPDLGSLQFHPNLFFNIYGIQKSNNNVIVQSADNMTTAAIFKDFGVKVNAIRIARHDPGTMYVLLNQKDIQKTTDSGATWVTVTPSSAASGGQTNITAIEVGKTPGELWAAYGNAQNTAKVLYSTDGGNNWSNITTSNLPAAAVSDIAYQRGTNGGVYIITITPGGTSVWYKNNTMPQWQQLGSNLPLIGYMKSRLFVVPYMNKIRFGSSRGAWENDLYEQSGVEAGLAADKQTPVCPGDSVQYYNTSAYARGSFAYQWQFPGGSPAASSLENPRVSYSVPGTYPASLTVTSASGTDAITVNNFITVGVNQCQVDTLAGNAVAFSTAAPGAPLVIGGYTALASTNNLTISAWIKPAATQQAWTGLFFAQNESNNTVINFRNTNLELGVHWQGNLWPTATNLFAAPGEWNHIAMVVYPDSIRIYLNGRSFTYVQPIAAANWKEILLGGFGNRTDRNYNGLIDEVRIYNRSLSEDEIRALRHLTVRDPSLENGLAGYLQFNNVGGYILDEKRNSQVGSRNYNSSNYALSTAPVASGTCEKAVITATGVYDYAAPQVSLSFPAGTVTPNGDVWVTSLNTLPFTIDTTILYPQPKYYIINNYGSNTTFTAPGIIFKNGSLPDPAFVNYYRLGLIKRGENKDNQADWSANLDSVQLSSNGTKRIDVPFSKSQITGPGQLFITANENYSLTLTGSLKTGNIVALNWQAIRDRNAGTYDLQRSGDGINFSAIYSIPAVAGTDTSYYSYSDNLPVNGNNFYRVKRSTVAGRTTYSGTVLIKVIITATVDLSGNNELGIRVSPVPVKRGNNIVVSTGRTGVISYEIISISGQIMFSNNFSQSTMISTGQLPAGTYFMVFTREKKKITGEIMVQ